MRDETRAHLARLTPATRRLAVILVNAAREAGWPLIVTSSRRNIEEQRRLVLEGRSRTLNSAHLSGNAFDVDVWGLGRDDVPEELWEALGPYGEALGLIWGGRFTSIYDPGHFELPSA